jgi:hypothetical protein
MAEPVALEDMSEEQLLVFADASAEASRRAEVDLLRVAYQWAVVHDPDRLDPADSGRPGRERARRLGGPGVPEVTEFAAAQLGARIGRSPYAAGRLIADALDIYLRLPELKGRVEAGQVRASYARHVAAKTRELNPSQAAYVDAAVAESADGRIPWSRFETLVDAKVAAAAPALARAKEEQASKATFARKLHASAAHGMASFLIRADLATIDQIDAAVTTLAAQLVESMQDATEDQRRVHAVLLLANPGATTETAVGDLLPVVQVYVHVYAQERFTREYSPDSPEGPVTDRIARIEGHGPVTEAWITRVLGPHARFKVTPVIDLAGQAPVDAYEIPDRHRQAVHLMSPADTFPYASCLSRQMQVDHTVPYHQGGVTGVGNYGPMTTRHHRIKTHGGWQVHQPFPGIYIFRDPHGAFYLVDHTGTRQLRPPTTPDQPPRAAPLTIEIWRNTTPIDLEYHAA